MAKTKEKENANPLITDLEKLFIYSGLIDSLRDISKTMYEKGNVSDFSLKTMLDHYLALRIKLSEVVHHSLRAEVLEWAPEVTEENTTIDSLFFALSQLSRYLDLVHQSPSFMLAQVVQEVNAKQIKDKLAEDKPSLPTSPEITTPTLGMGQYL